MAIIQISRITNRQGVSDNWPQLASGEIGLANDTRQIFIGNGGANAPKIENIEILTNYSDVLEVAETYVFKDSQIGFVVQTGETANSPIQRTLQDKLDDFANVRDFGAIGDGQTDDTEALNRAMFELFCREQITQVRRALYFPAGIYLVNDTIKIPSYAKLVGAGPNSTFIKSSDESEECVARTSDSLQQISANIGSSPGVRPKNIVIQDMSFESGIEHDVFIVDQAQDCYFINVNFIGNKPNIPSTGGAVNGCVRILSSGTFRSEHISFKNCGFMNHSLGVVADHDSDNIQFSSCKFDILFKGLKIGEEVTEAIPALIGPSGVNVIGGLFDNIYDRAIHVYDGVGFSSAFNYFKDCGNSGLGNGVPNTPVIDFGIGGCTSIGDSFQRPDTDDTPSTRRINVDSEHSKNFAIDGELGVKFGGYIRQYGQLVVLEDNQIGVETGITFRSDGDFSGVEIEYLIERDGKLRQGKMVLTHDSSNQALDDEYVENNGDLGIGFSITNSSNITRLRYTTTNISEPAYLVYSPRIIR